MVASLPRGVGSPIALPGACMRASLRIQKERRHEANRKRICRREVNVFAAGESVARTARCESPFLAARQSGIHRRTYGRFGREAPYRRKLCRSEATVEQVLDVEPD